MNVASDVEGPGLQVRNRSASSNTRRLEFESRYGKSLVGSNQDASRNSCNQIAHAPLVSSDHMTFVSNQMLTASNCEPLKRSDSQNYGSQLSQRSQRSPRKKTPSLAPLLSIMEESGPNKVVEPKEVITGFFDAFRTQQLGSPSNSQQMSGMHQKQQPQLNSEKVNTSKMMQETPKQ